MTNKTDAEILKKAYLLYDMSKTEFSRHTGIAYKTLEGWEKKGLSGIGKLLIESLIRERKQENLSQGKNIPNTIEAYEHKTIEIYDDRIKKYKSDDSKDLAYDLLINLGVDVYEVEEVLVNPKDNPTPHMIIKYSSKLTSNRH